MHLPYVNRSQAGRILGAELAGHNLPGDLIVLAIPRGGAPVGRGIAEVLGAPLDVVIVCKLGIPWQPELAMGAVAKDPFRMLDEELFSLVRISDQEVDAVIARERVEVARREKLYRDGRPALNVRDRTVVLTDDGLATGLTMLGAARYVRSLKPRNLLIAVPVGSAHGSRRLKNEADAFVCLQTPEPYKPASEWYADFRDVTDDEVQLSLGGDWGFGCSGLSGQVK